MSGITLAGTERLRDFQVGQFTGPGREVVPTQTLDLLSGQPPNACCFTPGDVYLGLRTDSPSFAVDLDRLVRKAAGRRLGWRLDHSHRFPVLQLCLLLLPPASSHAGTFPVPCQASTFLPWKMGCYNNSGHVGILRQMTPAGGLTFHGHPQRRTGKSTFWGDPSSRGVVGAEG